MNDRDLVGRQISALAILDDAHRATTWGGLLAGCALALVGFSCPALGIVGMALEPYVPSAMVHRMANIPPWVMALMVVCGGFLGGVALLLWLRDRNAGSATLAHLRARPDDPIVASEHRVVVRSGNRISHFFLTHRSGAVHEEVVTVTYEAKVRAAIDGVLAR